MKSEKKSRTVHTHEFKVEAVKLTLQGDRSVQEVADNLGIHISNLRRWKKAYLAEGDHAFPGQGRLAADEEEMRRLRREVEVLRQERDILKKAVGIFSQRPT
jgi:transposase